MSQYVQLFRMGKFDACEEECRRLLQKDKSDVNVWLVLCLCLSTQAKWSDLSVALAEALNSSEPTPRESSLLHQLAGDAAIRNGDTVRAVDEYQLACDLAPDRFDAKYALAQALFERNLFDRCGDMLRQVFSGGPDIGDQLYAESVYLFSRLPEAGTAKAFFEEYPNLKPRVEHPYFFYGVGNLLVQDQQYELAVRFFETANNLKRHSAPYDFSRDSQVLDQHQSNLYRFHSLPDFKFDSFGERVVFVVGMPRTGSSLLEQMLSAHSDVAALGEGDWLVRAIREVTLVDNDPKGIELIAELAKDETICSLVRENFYASIGTHAKVVVDKTLANFHFIELIASAFPEAIVIHATREKEPSIWSSFRTNFTKWIRYSESLDELSMYFDRVEGLLAGWKEKLPGKIVRVKYEKLIADPATVIQEILERLDLRFQEDCLSPWRQERVVDTASKVQLTQPIYQEANLEYEPFRELVSARLKELPQ